MGTPVKSKIGPLSVDSDVAEYLQEKYRSKVRAANDRGQAIPSFSRVVNDFLKEAILQEKTQRG